VAFSYFSHKVLRWLGPWLMLTGFAANLFLLGSPFFRWLFAAQLGFYGLGALAPVVRLAASAARYFIALNVGLGFGFLRFVLGLQRPFWSTTPRSEMMTATGRTDLPTNGRVDQRTGAAPSSRRDAAA